MEYALRAPANYARKNRPYVLILILMEYALRGFKCYQNLQNMRVLILILMEYALRVSIWKENIAVEDVLILILMEYALRVFEINSKQYRYESLNPYSNGICSKSATFWAYLCPNGCLNPYSNGICSKRMKNAARKREPSKS